MKDAGSQPKTAGSALTGEPGGHAFSLIELIGVLAVIAILAALASPVAIKRMDHAAYLKESNDLAAISNALVLQILSERRIRTETGWAQAVADWTRQPVARIQTTPRGYTRAFLLDTNGWFGTAAGALPYTNRTTGSASAPTNARLMIVSTIARALPVVTGRPGNAAFSNIWNTSEGSKPTTAAFTSWSGKGEDLLIQRINLEPLFHHLVLVNRDPPAASNMFSIGFSTLVGLTNVHRSYYLNGTDLGLYRGGSATNAQLRVLLEQDESFVFQAGRWAGQLDPVGGYSEVVGNEFAALAGQFLAAEWYAGAHKGGNQQGAVISMFNFMLTFQLWADQCPHFPTRGESSVNNIPEYQLLLDVGGGGASSLLNSFTGTDGLLKR